MSDECCVCLEEMTANEAKLIATCQHMFHFDCARDLADQDAKLCPLCRADIHGLFDALSRKRKQQKVVVVEAQPPQPRIVEAQPIAVDEERPLLAADMEMHCSLERPRTDAERWLALYEDDLVTEQVEEEGRVTKLLDWTLVDRQLKARALYENRVRFKTYRTPRGVGLTCAFKLAIASVENQVFVTTPVLMCTEPYSITPATSSVFKVENQKFIEFLAVCTNACREMMKKALVENDVLRRAAQSNPLLYQTQGPFVDRTHIRLYHDFFGRNFVCGQKYTLRLQMPTNIYNFAAQQGEFPCRLKWCIASVL